MIRKHCKICEREYEVCISCEKNHSWKVHTDTVDHYYIFTVIMSYQVNHDAKQAYRTLRERGVDFHNTAEYKPHIREILAEIYALTHENKKARKVVTEEVEIINTEYDATGDTAEVQE